LALFVATLSAELAVGALAYAPTSELLWFVNLKMFAIFQRSYYLLSDVIAFPGLQLFGIALPLFLLACYGLVASKRLALAVASNLSFGYAGLLLFAWQTPRMPSATQASLGPVLTLPTGAGFYVLTVILGTSLLSSAISHLIYLRAAREEI
jgi:hypothetical protein